MDNERALIVLIIIIAVGFLVIFSEKIMPYLRERKEREGRRKEREERQEIRELGKNSVR